MITPYPMKKEGALTRVALFGHVLADGSGRRGSHITLSVILYKSHLGFIYVPFFLLPSLQHIPHYHITHSVPHPITLCMLSVSNPHQYNLALSSQSSFHNPLSTLLVRWIYRLTTREREGSYFIGETHE